MSDASESLLRRLNHTPLRDLIRGHLSGRLDARARIAAADVPSEAKALIHRVVKQTRLWRIERVDVADELLAHFADALDADVPIDEAVRDFGDQRRAARLIRRAKKRSRPWWWQAVRGLGIILLALILFYIGVAVLFYTGSPSPSVNYLEQLNRRILAVPVEDQAWPLYREALVTLTDQPWRIDGSDRWYWADTAPQSEHWPEMAAFLRANEAAIELIRQGAAKSVLGLPMGGGFREEDLAAFGWSEEHFDGIPAFTTDVGLINVGQPYLGRLRHLANLVDRHALLAASEGDAQSLIADWYAVHGLAEHARAPAEGTQISQLVSISIHSMLLDSVERVLTRHPTLLSDSQLRDLAHQLSDVHSAADLLDFSVERLAFRDLVQRTYTDDGSGDGHITPQGLRLVETLTRSGAFSDSGVDRSSVAEAIKYAAEPRLLLLAASRKDLIEQYNRIMDRFQSDLHRPAWEVDQDWFEEHVLPAWLASPVDRVQYWLIIQTLPAYGAARRTAEQLLGRRDGLLVAIALKLYHRRYREYPDSLDTLVPALLPQIPRDRITGNPVRYRVVDGRPVVYSVGGDRDDDGGVMPITPDGDPNPYQAATWQNTAHAPDADWVLYPVSPVKR